MIEQTWRDRSAWYKIELRELEARGWAGVYETCGHGLRDSGTKFVWVDQPDLWTCAGCVRGVARAWAGCARCAQVTPAGELTVVCACMLLWPGGLRIIRLWTLAELCESCAAAEVEGI